MATDLRNTHVLGNTEGLVDFASDNWAVVGGDVSEPLHVGVLSDVETSWSDQTSEKMVINWKAIDVADVLFESFGEPDVLGDDLRSSLDVGSFRLLVVGETPASRSSGTRLLWDGQGNALDESTGNDSTLAVTRATSNTNSLGVDVMASGRLKSINDAVNSPSPGGQSGGRVTAAVECVELSGATRASVLLSGNIIIIEGDSSYTSRDRNGSSSVGNDSRNVGSTVSGDGNLEGDRLSGLGDVDGEFSTRVRAGDGRWLWWESSELVALEELRNLSSTTFPVGLGGDLLSVEKSEWVGEVGVGDQVQVRAESWANAWGSSWLWDAGGGRWWSRGAGWWGVGAGWWWSISAGAGTAAGTSGNTLTVPVVELVAVGA